MFDSVQTTGDGVSMPPTGGAELVIFTSNLAVERTGKSTLFTPRELEVIRWIAKGKSDWEIGEILFISRKTVNYHVERAKRKLRVATRTQAVLVAEKHGLL